MIVERLRLRARRTRQFPARLHPDDRHPDVREPHVVFCQIAQLVTDKVRTEFIGRGNYKIVPEATGADAVLVGAVTNVIDCADQLLDRAAGVALHDYRDGQHRAARRRERHRALEQPVASPIREEYDATSSFIERPDRVRRSVHVLQPGIQRRRARQQRVFAHGRERHPGSVLIAARLPR